MNRDIRQLPPVRDNAQLLPWLIQALAPTNRTRVKQLLKHGTVHVGGQSITRHDHPLKLGDIVTLQAVHRSSLPIIYEDDSLIIIDKPAGLLTVATDAERDDTAFRRLEAQLGFRPGVVHRLDRETSGLLMFAKSRDVQTRLQNHWNDVQKTYLAIVEGVPTPREGSIEGAIIETKSLKCRIAKRGEVGQHAMTHYCVTQVHGNMSLLQLRILTGRKHQIRVHLASLGTPVVGDTLYGANVDLARRLALHAFELEFPHPVTGTTVRVQSQLPADLIRIVKSTRT